MSWEFADLSDNPEQSFYFILYTFEIDLFPFRTTYETRFLRKKFFYFFTSDFQFFYLGFIRHIPLSRFRFQSPAVRLSPSVISAPPRNP